MGWLRRLLSLMMMPPKPRRLPIRCSIVIQDDCEPEPGEDHALNTTVHLNGFYMLHQNSPNCWCEPYISGYDEELDGWVCEHRWTMH